MGGGQAALSSPRSCCPFWAARCVFQPPARALPCPPALPPCVQQYPDVSSFASPARKGQRGPGSHTPTTLGRTFPPVGSPAGVAPSPSRGTTPEGLPRIVHSTRHGLAGTEGARPQGGFTRSSSMAAGMTGPAGKDKPVIDLKRAWIERIDVPKPSPPKDRPPQTLTRPSAADADDSDCAEYILSPDLRLQVRKGAEVVRIKPVEEQVPPASPLVPKRHLELQSNLFSPGASGPGPSPARSLHLTHGSPKETTVKFADTQGPPPSILLHAHASPLSMAMPGDDVDLDGLYTRSDMSTVVHAKQLRSEYHFVDPKEFRTGRGSPSTLESVRCAPAGIWLRLGVRCESARWCRLSYAGAVCVAGLPGRARLSPRPLASPSPDLC